MGCGGTTFMVIMLFCWMYLTLRCDYRSYARYDLPHLKCLSTYWVIIWNKHRKFFNILCKWWKFIDMEWGKEWGGSYGGSWGSVFVSMVRSTFELPWACIYPGLHVRVVRESSWVWRALWLPWEHPLISTVRSIYTWFLPSIVSTIGKKRTDRALEKPPLLCSLM